MGHAWPLQLLAMSLAGWFGLSPPSPNPRAGWCICAPANPTNLPWHGGRDVLGDGFPFLTSSVNSSWVKTTSTDSLPAPSAQVRVLSLVHSSATKNQVREKLPLAEEKFARRKRLMWNSCAMDFMNNLLKINFNGKLRTEISSAVLCSQWVTCLHRSTWQNLAPQAAQLTASPREQGSNDPPGLLPAGVRAGGWQRAAFPQSAQLWAGFCFWEL